MALPVTGFPKIYHALATNGSPLPIFETDDNNSFFHATIRIHEAFVDEAMYIACNQLATSISDGVKELIVRLNTQKMSRADIQLATALATKSRQYFDKAVFKPAMDLGLIAAADNEPIHSPKTKYQLTELGLAVLHRVTSCF